LQHAGLQFDRWEIFVDVGARSKSKVEHASIEICALSHVSSLPGAGGFASTR
jgi:hypothetical protein